MLSLSQRTKVRAALEKRASSTKSTDARRLRRLANEGPLFDNFLDKKRKEFDRANPTKKGAIGDGAFLQWLTDFINSGTLQKLIDIIMSLIGMFAAKAPPTGDE